MKQNDCDDFLDTVIIGSSTLYLLAKGAIQMLIIIIIYSKSYFLQSLKSEAPAEVKDKKPLANWPKEGEVVVKDYSMRYREGLPLVLNNINCHIKPKEKIGIVGRTGSGKSFVSYLEMGGGSGELLCEIGNALLMEAGRVRKAIERA